MISEKMQEAFELIKSDSTFTRGDFARDSKGQPVSVDSPDAVCFCSIGAILRVASGCSSTQHLMTRALQESLFEIDSTRTIVQFNDFQPKSDIIRLWEAAILCAKQKDMS